MIDYCDEVLMGEEFTEDGLVFSDEYYEGDYISDYEKALAANLPTVYHVQNTWENYDVIALIIDQKFKKWKEASKS